MDLTPISTLPEPAKIISLKVARNKYRPGKCQHKHMTIDEDLATVECDDCGEKLNPVAMLLRFATEESQWQRRGELLSPVRLGGVGAAVDHDRLPRGQRRQQQQRGQQAHHRRPSSSCELGTRSPG